MTLSALWIHTMADQIPDVRSLSLTTCGGFAGMLGLRPQVIHLSELAPADQQSLRLLVQELRASPPLLPDRTDQARDLLVYLLVVEDENGDREEYEANDLSRSEAFLALSGWIRDHGDNAAVDPDPPG